MAIAHSMPAVVDPERTEPTTWTVEYRIPLDMLAKHLGLYQPEPESKARTTAADLADTLKHLTKHGFRPPNPILIPKDDN